MIKLTSLFRTVPTKILNYLYGTEYLARKNKHYTGQNITDISRATKISYTTTFKTLNKLEESGFVSFDHIGNAKFYRLTEKGRKEIKRLLKSGDNLFFNQVFEVDKI